MEIVKGWDDLDLHGAWCGWVDGVLWQRFRFEGLMRLCSRTLRAGQAACRSRSARLCRPMTWHCAPAARSVRQRPNPKPHAS